MIIKYWGVRGSIPSPLTGDQIAEKQMHLIQKLIADGGTQQLFSGTPDPAQIQAYLTQLPPSLSGTYGGDTTCIEVQARNSPLIIIDAGTGIRNLGKVAMERLFKSKNLNPLNTIDEYNREIHLFLSHYHWDHLQGFPFFSPGFVPGPMKIRIHFYGKKNTQQRLSEVLEGQQQCPNFPVVWDDMPCGKHCIELGRLDVDALKIGEAEVRYQELTHPDAVFAYSVAIDGKKFVFATDTEHKDSPDPRLHKLGKGGNILYYDSQYTPEEYIGTPGTATGALSKFDWGHSTYEWAIKNALHIGIPTVVLGHHEPLHTDFQLEDLLTRACSFRDQQLALPCHAGKSLNVILAAQGLEQKL
jgi:phosphoribosyl 1,2-cyclic phosphodiesterase